MILFYKIMGSQNVDEKTKPMEGRLDKEEGTYRVEFDNVEEVEHMLKAARFGTVVRLTDSKLYFVERAEYKKMTDEVVFYVEPEYGELPAH